MASEDQKPMHIAVFPWLAFGHMIPFLNFSKHMALKGHKVSFISTPRNIDRLPNLGPEFANSISFVKLSLPRVEHHPEDVEATTDIRGGECGEQEDLLKRAFDGLEVGLTRFLEESVPDWIVYDFAQYWLPPIATRLGISRACFIIISAWGMAFGGPVDSLLGGSDYRTRIEDFIVPPEWIDFESKVAFRRFEAKWLFRAGQKGSAMTDSRRIGMVISGSEVMLVRHCYEFEPQWISLLQRLYKIPVLPVGLLLPELENVENDDAWPVIKGWLDRQEKRSVVYVAFGSEVNISQEQLTELALGLELSGVAFLWVLRTGENESLRLPSEFEKRTHGVGIVWRHWVPQQRILSHGAMGGFLTHCGIGSVYEALRFGHPFIGLPFFVDQGLVARVIVDEGLGIEVPRNDEDGSYTRDSVANTIRLVMIENEGKVFRKKAE